MGVLRAKQRNKLPDSAFALPNRRYPIDTPNRARAALSRIAQFGTEREKAIVKVKVRRRYPSMGVE